MRVCSIPGCGRPYCARGYCNSHWARWRRYGDPRAVIPLGHLAKVTSDAQRMSPVCVIDGCQNQSNAKGVCCTHRRRMRLYGSYDPPKIGARRHRTVYRGYVWTWAPGHPNGNPHGRILEHRLVMSAALGRPLRPDESVHHKNGDRQDNRLANLELWSKQQPTGQRVEDKTAWAIELLRLYKPDALAAQKRSPRAPNRGSYLQLSL